MKHNWEFIGETTIKNNKNIQKKHWTTEEENIVADEFKCVNCGHHKYTVWGNNNDWTQGYYTDLNGKKRYKALPCGEEPVKEVKKPKKITKPKKVKPPKKSEEQLAYEKDVRETTEYVKNMFPHYTPAQTEMMVNKLINVQVPVLQKDGSIKINGW